MHIFKLNFDGLCLGDGYGGVMRDSDENCVWAFILWSAGQRKTLLSCVGLRVLKDLGFVDVILKGGFILCY